MFFHSLMPPDRRLFNLDRRTLERYDRSSSVRVEGVGASGRKNKKSAGTTKGGGSESLSPCILLLCWYEETLKRRCSLYVDRYLCPILGGDMGRK